MDFDETPEEAAFRDEVRAFLRTHVPKLHSNERDQNSIFITDHEKERAHVQRARDWQRIKFDNGWAGITWPKEYGGRGGTSIEDGIFKQEEAKLISASGVFAVGIGMAGPMLIAHGTDDQKERFLPPMLRGEEVWCQLFSEPGAGSDLGGLRTSAVRDGDEWIVNGQKVWTSGAHYSDWAILLTRTDVSAPKHRGITYFLVDMRSPGIEVRPLRQITGAAHFNEVFLSDVRIPHGNVVGQVNAGWGPMMTTLANERTLIGGGQGRTGIGDLVALARTTGTACDAGIRQELAKAFTRLQIQMYLGYRVRTAALRGQQPGPESSVMKLAVSLHLHEVGNLVMAMQGAAGMLAGGSAIDDGRWQMEFLGQFGARIGGGTDQIQRNTIGEKVLQLPPEPRVDKGIPFRDIPG
jgi:alkylation response protein AidB-like acyl-CoA dehydrogenase